MALNLNIFNKSMYGLKSLDLGRVYLKREGNDKIAPV